MRIAQLVLRLLEVHGFLKGLRSPGPVYRDTLACGYAEERALRLLEDMMESNIDGLKEPSP